MVFDECKRSEIQRTRGKPEFVVIGGSQDWTTVRWPQIEQRWTKAVIEKGSKYAGEHGHKSTQVGGRKNQQSKPKTTQGRFWNSQFYVLRVVRWFLTSLAIWWFWGLEAHVFRSFAALLNHASGFGTIVMWNKNFKKASWNSKLLIPRATKISKSNSSLIFSTVQ